MTHNYDRPRDGIHDVSSPDDDVAGRIGYVEPRPEHSPEAWREIAANVGSGAVLAADFTTWPEGTTVNEFLEG